MRLSLRKPELEVHAEVSKILKSKAKDKAQQTNADSAKLTLSPQEDADFCRQSLR